MSKNPCFAPFLATCIILKIQLLPPSQKLLAASVPGQISLSKTPNLSYHIHTHHISQGHCAATIFPFFTAPYFLHISSLVDCNPYSSSSAAAAATFTATAAAACSTATTNISRAPSSQCTTWATHPPKQSFLGSNFWEKKTRYHLIKWI